MKNKNFVETENFKNEGIIKIRGIYNSEEEALNTVNSKLDAIKNSISETLNKKLLLNLTFNNKSSLDITLSFYETILFFDERNLIEGVKHNYYAQKDIDANIKIKPYAEQIGSTGKYTGGIKVNYTDNDEFKSLTEKCICVLNSVNKLEELSKC